MSKINKNRGYFRYGVSDKERFDNFFKAVEHGATITLAMDSDYLSLVYESGETLPVWLSPSEAGAALAKDKWPKFEFVSVSPSEFKELFPPPYNEMYVSIRPNVSGNCITMAFREFVDRLDTTT